MRGGFGTPFFCCRCLHGWRRRAGTRPRLRRHCPVLTALRSGLKRYAGPAAPLALAACGSAPARRCAWLRAAVWRGFIRALPCGAARGPARSGGRGGPSPSAPAALSLAVAAGGALPRLRSGSGCVSSPSPRSAGAASAPALRPPGSGRPLGLPPPRFVPPALRALGPGGAALGLSPSLAAPGRAAPGRGFVLGLVRWCACGRGAGVPLAAASGGRPPALAGGQGHIFPLFSI